MIKIIAFLSSALFLFIASNFLSQDAQVTVQPSVPSNVKPGEEFVVELTINKSSLAGFAYLQQYLPEGFSATPVETHGAKFVFENELVRYMWVELPKENSFKISYKVKTDVTCNGLKTLNGEFSYIENDQTKRFPLTPSVLLLSGENEVADAGTNKAGVASTGTVEDKKPQPVIPVYSSTPSPEKGIYYKVQIAATRRSPDRDNKFFESKYKIDDPVEITMHEGWKKYVVGTYDKYSSANQHRTETMAKIPDAFVVAYRDGERIPLQQAIKASHRNQ
jgi:hypothetical protein